jgi:hypothetical protein
MGIPELNAWQRNRIASYAYRLHMRKMGTSVFKTVVITNAVIIAMCLLWRLI